MYQLSYKINVLNNHSQIPQKMLLNGQQLFLTLVLPQSLMFNKLKWKKFEIKPFLKS